MSPFSVDPVAARQIDEVYDYSRRHWGAEQAERYVHGMFEHFGAISEQRVIWRAIPAAFGIAGFYSRYERHYVYWKRHSDHGIAIFAVLHVRMQQAVRLRRTAGD